MNILIVANSISSQGGIGNCLYRQLLYLINQNPENKITLLLTDHYIEESILQSLKGIEIKFVEYYEDLNISFYQLLKFRMEQREYLKFLKEIYLRILYKFNYRYKFYEYISDNTKGLELKYDIAISYNVILNWIPIYLLKKIQAEKKILWGHIDINQEDIKKIKGFSTLKVKDIKLFKSIVNEYSQIICVSEDVKNSVIKYFKECKFKIKVIHNLVDTEKIISLSNEGNGFDDNFQGVRLLTVGRTSLEKGIDIALKSAKELKLKGYNFRWYFIGRDDCPVKYKEYIKKNSLESYVYFLNSKENPLPFVKECDIYIHCSRIEGYCTAINEARIIGKPIITTKVSGANEQIINGYNGFIVEGSEQAVVNRIEYILNNKNLKVYFEKNNQILKYIDLNISSLNKMKKLFQIKEII